MSICVRVCVCIQPLKAGLEDTGSETRLLKVTSEKIFEGTQNFTKKDISHRFCILRSGIDQSGTPVFMSFCVVSWEGGASVGRGCQDVY